MLTDILIIGVSFVAGWYSRGYFGTYATMKARVKDIFKGE